MPLPSDFSSPLLLLRENPKAVLEALRMGRIESMDAAGDRITDLHVLYALKSGLLAEAAASFPDPRAHPEIPAHVLLTASIAAAFQGEYALRETGCALHSPAILAELGLNAAWLAPGEGLSRRGTETQALFHGDTLRKLLYQIAAADHDAGRRPGESLLRWWNETVGPALLRHAGGGTGVWIRDATQLIVNLANPRYEGSEVATEEGKQPQRGYKLGLLSALIDTGRLLVGVAWGGIRTGDLPLCQPFVAEGTPLRPGDTLLQDRGLLDGAEITVLKRDLGVDVVVPLKKAMLSYRLAVLWAERNEHRWEAHPTRPRQQIQRVCDIGGPWESLEVPLNGCVVREWEALEGGIRVLGVQHDQPGAKRAGDPPGVHDAIGMRGRSPAEQRARLGDGRVYEHAAGGDRLSRAGGVVRLQPVPTVWADGSGAAVRGEDEASQAAGSATAARNEGRGGSGAVLRGVPLSGGGP